MRQLIFIEAQQCERARLEIRHARHAVGAINFCSARSSSIAEIEAQPWS